jgi:S1-C subfamily serine protease
MLGEVEVAMRRSCAVLLVCAVPALAVPAVGQELTSIVQSAQPAVTTILTYDAADRPIGQGTGFFVSPVGHMVTNHHVLRGAHRAEVRTFDGREYTVRLVLADDEPGDLVRVSVHTAGESVHYLSFGPDLPEIASTVVVVGSPLGLEQTVSHGIVASIRELPRFGTIIQVTAPISPGSSGSPVINMKGHVVGVATAVHREGQNLNFAVAAARALNMPEIAPQPMTAWGSAHPRDVRTAQARTPAPEPARFAHPLAGETVRVHSAELAGGIAVGQVMPYSDGQTLVLQDAARVPFRVPVNALSGIDVHGGQRDARTAGTLIGLVAGAVVGYLGAVNSSNCTRPQDDLDREFCDEDKLMFPLLGGGAGALVGWGIGMAIKHDIWVEVPLERIRSLGR